MNILEEIVAYKTEELKRQIKVVPSLELLKMLDKAPTLPRFKNKLQEKGLHLIAEAKKASPSAGIIRENFDARQIALALEAGGAACISVLTEDRFFKGSLSYLDAAVQAVDVPLLRKDFIIDEYHIYESKVHKADAVLLIAAILKSSGLKDMLCAAEDVKLDALVEVHDEDELKMALDCGASIIGINTRNLKDFSVDFDILSELRQKVPADKILVCESGVKSIEDLDTIKKFNVNAVLVGEALMRAKDVEVLTREYVRRLNS